VTATVDVNVKTDKEMTGVKNDVSARKTDKTNASAATTGKMNARNADVAMSTGKNNEESASVGTNTEKKSEKNVIASHSRTPANLFKL
jgi:hypothetical protein